MYAFTSVVPVPNARSFAVPNKTSCTRTPSMVLSDRETGRRPHVPSAHNPKTKATPKPSSSSAPPMMPDSLRRATKPDIDLPVRVTGNNISVTDSLRVYIRDKLDKVIARYAGMLTKVDVHLTVEQNHSIVNKNKVEVIAFIGKTTLRAEVKDSSMYAAIDAMQTRMARVIRKFKERSIATIKSQQKSRTSSGAVDEEEDAEQQEYMDMYAEHEMVPGVPKVNEIVRRKVFPMPLQTVEEAVLCCEYVDHPWYLFRNADTNEISLVYKRNHGGYGLIEPSNPDGKDEEQVL